MTADSAAVADNGLTALEIARKVRARGIADGWPYARIARAIFDECGPEPGTSRIKANRLAYGITLADVAEQVRALAMRDGKPPPKLSETLLSAYESGSKRPGPEYLHYLCLVYRSGPAELGYPVRCLCGADHGAPPADEERPPGRAGAVPAPGSHAQTGGPPAPVAVVPDTTAEADDRVLRRALLRMLSGGQGATVTDCLLLTGMDNVRRRLDDTLSAATVSARMLDQWEEDVAGHGHRYQRVPPLRLLCDVLLELSEVSRMCAQRQPIDLQDRLCGLAARLAGLSGVLLLDLGDPRLARSYFRTAAVAADETGDRALRAWVIARESLVPLFGGDPPQALALARRARDLAGTTPCAARAMAGAVEARALAELAGPVAAGTRASSVVGQARTVLEHARAAYESIPAEQRADTAFGYTERQLNFHTGDALTRLGADGHARWYLDAALAAYPDAEMVDRPLIGFAVAECRLYGGEPAEAMRLAREVLLGVPEEHRCDLVLGRARRLEHDIVARHGETRDTRDFHEVVRPA
ncbi:MAG TPA: XRE family transcriptional regulator [Streptosporangiaceae bacterium]|jgi:transcriptional regulator with XRE-family HTH domain